MITNIGIVIIENGSTRVRNFNAEKEHESESDEITNMRVWGEVICFAENLKAAELDNLEYERINLEEEVRSDVEDAIGEVISDLEGTIGELEDKIRELRNGIL